MQLAIDNGEYVDDRVGRALALAELATARADLVLLPEMWPTGAFNVELGIANAQPIDGPLVDALSKVAARSATWIHGGSFVESDPDGSYFNTSVLFGPDGSLAATYRKIHLFGFDAHEAALLTAGFELVVVDTPLGRTGLATCYDLRFPELFRGLIDQGATAVLVASGWPTSRIRRWTVLAQARAMEDQLWFVGCNAVGLDSGTELGGRSIVTDPWGDIVGEGGTEEEILHVELDPAIPQFVRQSFPVLKDRRLR